MGTLVLWLMFKPQHENLVNFPLYKYTILTWGVRLGVTQQLGNLKPNWTHGICLSFSSPLKGIIIWIFHLNDLTYPQLTFGTFGVHNSHFICLSFQLHDLTFTPQPTLCPNKCISTFMRLTYWQSDWKFAKCSHQTGKSANHG